MNEMKFCKDRAHFVSIAGTIDAINPRGPLCRAPEYVERDIVTGNMLSKGARAMRERIKAWKQQR